MRKQPIQSRIRLIGICTAGGMQLEGSWPFMPATALKHFGTKRCCNFDPLIAIACPKSKGNTCNET